MNAVRSFLDLALALDRHLGVDTDAALAFVGLTLGEVVAKEEETELDDDDMFAALSV